MFSASKLKLIQIFGLFFLVAYLQFFFNLPLVFAQSSSESASTQSMSEGTLGVAHIVEVQDKNTPDGSILSLSDKGPILSSTPYDPQVIGVVSRDAAIVLGDDEGGESVPVISTGTVYVLVSNEGGAIKKGDLITTSTIPGVGVKATNAGYVLGDALEDYTSSDNSKPGEIAINLNLHYFNTKPTLAGSLSDILKIALLPTKEGPSSIFKYIIAAVVVISSFVLGFLSFSRAAAKGVEALGRNPSASKIIHLGIIFNISITVVIVLAGLTVAFLILRL